MQTLSLWQPWASAIALGSKRVETRSWGTRYRGRLAIHAAKRCVKAEMIDFASYFHWLGALKMHRTGKYNPLWECLPFGAVVAICDLVDCRPTNSFTQEELDTRRLPEGETSPVYSWTERHMGDFSIGRFGWVLENIVPLKEPIPCRGFQGLFNVPDLYSSKDVEKTELLLTQSTMFERLTIAEN